MKIRPFLFLLIIVSFNLIGENLLDLNPSLATLSMKGGDMEVWLKKKENNIWEMGSFVDGGRVFEREEVSVFEINQNSLVPLDHKIRMKILFLAIRNMTYSCLYIYYFPL